MCRSSCRFGCVGESRRSKLYDVGLSSEAFDTAIVADVGKLFWQPGTKPNFTFSLPLMASLYAPVAGSTVSGAPGTVEAALDVGCCCGTVPGLRARPDLAAFFAAAAEALAAGVGAALEAGPPSGVIPAANTSPPRS